MMLEPFHLKVGKIAGGNVDQPPLAATNSDALDRDG